MRIDEPIAGIGDDHREEDGEKKEDPGRGVFIGDGGDVVDMDEIFADLGDAFIFHAGRDLVVRFDRRLLRSRCRNR